MDVSLPLLLRALDATYRSLEAPMVILEVDQFGRYPDEGEALDAFLAATREDAYKPHLLPNVPETKTAAWAKRWYRVDAEGRLRHHSDQFDSSD